MYRRFTALIAVFLLAASVWAGDPWKDKAYKQWDEKDIRKVMTESPWVRAVRVENTWAAPPSPKPPHWEPAAQPPRATRGTSPAAPSPLRGHPGGLVRGPLGLIPDDSPGS